MPEAVKARCPGCKRELRIPAEWMNCTFRCKHCRTIIQAKPKVSSKELASRVPPAASPEPARPEDVAKPPSIPSRAMAQNEPNEKASTLSASAIAAEGLEFPAFDEGPIVRVPARYRRSRLNRWARLAMVFLLVVIGGGAVSYFWTPLKQMGASIRQALDQQLATEPTEPAPKDNTPASPEIFPRRALAICVNNYLYANPI